MSDFAHTFNQSRPIGHPKTNTGPLAISNQSWPIGHFQSILAHQPLPINYSPSAFHFYHSCIAYKTHRNHKSKSHLYHHFDLKNQPLNPILPRDLKGVPGNGADPLLKYLAPPPSFILFILFYLDILWLFYVRINLYSDFNSWPLIDPKLKRPKLLWQDNRRVLPAAH